VVDQSLFLFLNSGSIFFEENGMKRWCMLLLALFVMGTTVQAEPPYKADFMPGPLDIKSHRPPICPSHGVITRGTIFYSELRLTEK
jgi:hypothetical protein